MLDGKVAPKRGGGGLHNRVHSGLIIKVALMAAIGEVTSKFQRWLTRNAYYEFCVKNCCYPGGCEFAKRVISIGRFVDELSLLSGSAVRT